MPPSIIDKFGILRKGSKAQLMKKLVIVSTEPSNPDYVIVDAGQLLYHVVWPSDGTVSTIATSMVAKLQPYNALPTTVVFDRYGNVSAKDHERERYRCVCRYLQPHSHFTSFQQRSHNEEQGEQNTSLAPPLHMYSDPQYCDGR